MNLSPYLPEYTNRTEELFTLSRLFMAGGRESALAVGIADTLLQKAGSLGRLMHMRPAQLRAIGLPERDIEMLGAAEQMRRVSLQSDFKDQLVISGSSLVVDLLRAHLAHRDREFVTVLFLNCRKMLLDVQDMSYGNHRGAYVDIRSIVKQALEVNADSIIISHNHPSGEHDPSREDVQITRRLMDACASVSVGLVDHLIISRKGHTSFREQGLL